MLVVVKMPSRPRLGLSGKRERAKRFQVELVASLLKNQAAKLFFLIFNLILTFKFNFNFLLIFLGFNFQLKLTRTLLLGKNRIYKYYMSYKK